MGTRASTPRCSSCTSSWQPESFYCFFLSTLSQQGGRNRRSLPRLERLLRPVRPTQMSTSNGFPGAPCWPGRRPRAARRPAPDRERASVVGLTLPQDLTQSNHQPSHNHLTTTIHPEQMVIHPSNHGNSQQKNLLQIAQFDTSTDPPPSQSESLSQPLGPVSSGRKVTLRCLNGSPLIPKPKSFQDFPMQPHFPPSQCKIILYSQLLNSDFSLLLKTSALLDPFKKKLKKGPRMVTLLQI